MKSKNVPRIWVVIFLLVMGGAVALFRLPREGDTAVFAEYNDPQLGSIHVVGRYGGLLEGWDIAFFHQDRENNWFGYYLGHEEPIRWNATLEVTKIGVVNIWRSAVKVAEYQPAVGNFKHALQRVNYSRADAREGKPLVWWGLKEQPGLRLPPG